MQSNTLALGTWDELMRSCEFKNVLEKPASNIKDGKEWKCDKTYTYLLEQLFTIDSLVSYEYVVL